MRTGSRPSGAAARRAGGIAAVVADGPIERGEEPLVGRREHDEVPAGAEAVGGAGQLGAVVLDVLEDVHIEDRVERRLVAEVVEGADDHPAAGGQLPGGDRPGDPVGQARRRARSRSSGRSPRGRAPGSCRRARRRPPAPRCPGTERPGGGRSPSRWSPPRTGRVPTRRMYTAWSCASQGDVRPRSGVAQAAGGSGRGASTSRRRRPSSRDAAGRSSPAGSRG